MMLIYVRVPNLLGFRHVGKLCERNPRAEDHGDHQRHQVVALCTLRLRPSIHDTWFK